MKSKYSSDAIYIGLGANLPSQGRSPAQTIVDAYSALEAAGIEVVRRSSLWRSPAWPDPGKPPYANAVAEIVSACPAEVLMPSLLQIESAYGRRREMRWDSRTLDLDLLDYRGEVIEQPPELILPHPRATQRAFVLLPLQEIAPDWCDPVSGMKIAQLIERLNPGDRAATLKL